MIDIMNIYTICNIYDLSNSELKEAAVVEERAIIVDECIRDVDMPEVDVGETVEAEGMAVS